MATKMTRAALSGKKRETPKGVVKIPKSMRKTPVDELVQTMSPSEVRKFAISLNEKYETITDSAWCYICDTHKKRDQFYSSTDPTSKSGLCPVCKECARKMALRVDKHGNEHDCTKESIQLALKYLNKPYLESVWNSAVQEHQSLKDNYTISNIWSAYIRTISSKAYNTMTYFDSDFYKMPVIYDDEKTVENQIDNKDIIDSYEQNKDDTIRLLGYDPFSKESPSDQPFLYANLIGYLDASSDANDDRMRVSSIIEIVKGFNHIEKINDLIAKLISDTPNMEHNIVTIRALEDTKTKITSSILGLAKDNGISLKNSVNASKGENTWTGKVRKLKEMDLRDAEMNLYDTEYSEGLRQVAEVSNAAIIKQIKLDENDYADMLTQQRALIEKYKQIADENEEKARILLRENGDLKDRIKKVENG